uniref:Putative ovule protein n=1 Tax=Solanum chacoense TaxID=4108 RepID=A0A0V0HX14_SOLCH
MSSTLQPPMNYQFMGYYFSHSNIGDTNVHSHETNLSNDNDIPPLVYPNIQDIDLCTINGKCRDKHRKLWLFPKQVGSMENTRAQRQNNVTSSSQGTPFGKLVFIRLVNTST